MILLIIHICLLHLLLGIYLFTIGIYHFESKIEHAKYSLDNSQGNSVDSLQMICLSGPNRYITQYINSSATI